LNVFMVQTWGFVQSFDQPGWSISAECAAYLLFPVLLIPTIFRKPAAAWISAALCAATLAVLCVLPSSFAPGQHAADAPLDFHLPWLAFPVVRCIPEFMLGILSFRLASTPWGVKIGSSRWIAPAAGLGILALLTVPRTDLAVVLLFPLFTTSLATGTHLPGRLLASTPAHLLGRLSYSVYLTHELLAASLSWISREVHERAPSMAQQPDFAVAVGMALTFLTFPIALLAFNIIEVPGRRWLREMLERRPAEPIVRAIPSPSPI
jgi:peptidoglycan/LPS O-acetylase OafA/YrhL